MEYNFNEIEQKWQKHWNDAKAYSVSNTSSKPKYYVLDMFPYPSGAGLHVGHPLGYIASDIFSRYKRLKGYNVLHPMGYDAFGLPAEQYAIEHGVHPAVSTDQNIRNFRNQLDKIGFCYDWEREVRTSDPTYHKWTQWIFLQLFNSYFHPTLKKATPIAALVASFEQEGSVQIDGLRAQVSPFEAAEWKAFDEKKQQEILMEFRLAFCGYGEVNWCETLGTVLANDEVVNGVSERGGYPVVKKTLRQWYLRITDYADRLLNDLDKLEWSEALKEMQTNWIGKSTGAEIDFRVKTSEGGATLKVYTTRPDTIFGVDFMVVAPEHALVASITTAEQQAAVDTYITYVKSRSERERQAEKKITGAFTGAYAINPFDGREIPIWISEYVLAGYGTGAIMAVPCGDERDFKFAHYFNIPITNILGDAFNGTEPNPTKDAILHNSGFLNGIVLRDAIDIVVTKLEEMGIGKRKINFRMRDAAFSRQRYWGEPFPIVWKNGIAYPLPESELPLTLPKVDSYSPGPDGEGPLANIPAWVNQYANKADLFTHNTPSGDGGSDGGFALETNTMPGYAGSSWYFLRYMDPHNNEAFASKEATDYWDQVDLYIGGTEHAVGHLLYSRMWTKALHDLGHLSFDEPFRRLLNQGMITGSSRFVYRVNGKGCENLLWGIIENDFKQYNFLREDNQKMDFISDEYKIGIEVTSVEGMDGIEILKYQSKSTEGYTFIILSNEDVLEKYINGTLVNFLATLLEKRQEYLSDSKEKISTFISYTKLNLVGSDGYDSFHVDVNIVDGNLLNIDNFKKTQNGRYYNSHFIFDDNNNSIEKSSINYPSYSCGSETEKMSKSKFNTVNPDDLVAKFGADTFRMYEMFLGPIEQSKPWDTKGIEGVHRFLKKLWRLFFDDVKGKQWNEQEPNPAELKILHRTIKKIEDDTERFSFNTAVSAFMVCVNELSDIKCHKRAILEPVLVLIAPYAPHIAEELWHALGNTTLVIDAAFPIFEAKYIAESAKDYPVSINGKLRTNITIGLDVEQAGVETIVLDNDVVKKWLEGKDPKKIVFVKNRMINIVL